MSTTSRHYFSWLFSLLAALVTVATSAPSWADSYPNRAISIITPVAPGSPFDLLARLFADRLSRKIKQSVVVENVTGGQAMLATKKVLNATADGYTLFLTPGGLATTPVILKDAGYTLDDFIPIAPVGQAPYILFVSASVKATDIPSFMKEVKERGKSMNHGVLTTSQLSVVLSKKIAASAGGEPYEEIGYKGSPEMIRALLADDVQMIATTYSIAGPHLKDGKVKAIGVVGREKSLNMPELKTFIEAGYEDIYINIVAALYARSTTPKDIVTQIRKLSGEVIADPSFKESMKPTGAETWNIPVGEMQAAFQQEAKNFKQDIEKFNLKLN